MKANTFLAGSLAGIMFIYYCIVFEMGYYRFYQIPLFLFGLFVILYNLGYGKENKSQFQDKRGDLGEEK
jgi:hypothetical protein